MLVYAEEVLWRFVLLWRPARCVWLLLERRTRPRSAEPLTHQRDRKLRAGRTAEVPQSSLPDFKATEVHLSP